MCRRAPCASANDSMTWWMTLLGVALQGWYTTLGDKERERENHVTKRWFQPPAPLPDTCQTCRKGQRPGKDYLLGGDGGDGGNGVSGGNGDLHTDAESGSLVQRMITCFCWIWCGCTFAKLFVLFGRAGCVFELSVVETLEQNFKLLEMLDYYKNLNLPILAGISRKSMVYKTLNTNANQALNGSTALHMVALQKGAKLLRVHDVKEAMECIQLHEALRK